MGLISISFHESAAHLTGKARNHDNLKAAILEAGRYSVFEASQNPRIFARILRDPQIVTFDFCFPWNGIRKRLTEDQKTPRLGRIERLLETLEDREEAKLRKAREICSDEIVCFESASRLAVKRWRRWERLIWRETFKQEG